MYANQPIVDGTGYVPYSDTPQPRVFANVSPLDPQLFSSIAEHVSDLTAGRINPKYSPAEVAAWLGALADESGHGLAEFSASKDGWGRRLVEDVAVQRGLATFFAAKLRSGLYFTLWLESKNRQAGERALLAYRLARETWATMAMQAKAIYVADVSYGEIAQRRGYWLDRLPAIDADIAAMQRAIVAQPGDEAASPLLDVIAVPPPRPAMLARHIAPTHFRPSADLPLVLSIPGDVSAQLFYRHVNHGERWRALTMAQEGDTMRAAIPASYTNSPYPLQYYFVLQQDAQVWFYPGFDASLSNQPYFAVWERG